ncbi:MAG: alpha/beta hydrolase [Pseudomonadota bacterium]
MAKVQAGEIELGMRTWGSGDITVLFIHGNLASKDWIEMATTWFPPDLKVIGLDWRGCGDSDRPTPDEDYGNYSMAQHAADMLAAMDSLEIERCHLITHSTGGVIAARMQLEQPDRFGKVLALNPVSPAGLKFDEAGMAMFEGMRKSRDMTRAVMAGAASSLFKMDSFVPGGMPQFRSGVDHMQSMFDKVIDQTFSVGEGIWMGTPVNLTAEHESGALAERIGELHHETLVIWGAQDPIIPREDLENMVATMPNARLVEVPGVGHSMNIEAPQMFAGYVAAMFSGVQP